MKPNEVWKQKLAKSACSAAAISTDDSLCALFFPKEEAIRVVKLATGKILWTVSVSGKDLVNAELEFAPDSKKLLFLNSINRTLTIIDAETGDVLHEIDHREGLYAPRFLRESLNQEKTDRVFCFSGDRTFKIVTVDLNTGEVSPFFDLLADLPEAKFEKRYGNVVYRFRDFMIDSERLYIGLDGTAMAVGLADEQVDWTAKLSDAKPVLFHRATGNMDASFVYCRTEPHIIKLDLTDGKTIGSSNSPLHFIVGQQDDVLILINHPAMTRAATLRAIKLDSKTHHECQLQEESLTRGFCCSPSGSYFVMVDASGEATCSKIVVGEDVASGR